MAGRIYSLGYEGFSVESFVERLATAQVTTVVDVRLNPVSRRPGFSRSALHTALARVGIDYVHEPQLGNPSENRASFRTGDGDDGRRRMRELLENGSGPALQRLVERATDNRVAVVCVERDRSRCHRQVITDMAQEMEPGIEVIHIL